VNAAARYRIAGLVGRGVLNALLATVRFRTEHRERFDALTATGQPALYALWHGRLLPLTYYHRNRGIGAVISQSDDGEYIAQVVKGWGFEPVRGSTSRGGREALREVVRRVRAGQSIAITPDGPRGPRQKLQPGILRAAQLSGAPILPVAAGCSRAWWPGGWDRFCVPKPFSEVRLIYGEPRHVPRELDDSGFRRLLLELEREMNALTEQVDGDGGPGR
jgi:lysophospholipid acyltransferase (LPLAT)-like uncharacterized protein